MSPVYNEFNPEHRAIHEAYGRAFDRAHPGPQGGEDEAIDRAFRNSPSFAEWQREQEKKSQPAADEQQVEQQGAEPFLDQVVAQLQSDPSDPYWGPATYEASLDRTNNFLLERFGSIEEVNKAEKALRLDRDPVAKAFILKAIHLVATGQQ